jgi:hypothetical protein
MWIRDTRCYKHPLEVAQDVLHDRQMVLSRIMHMQTDLLHCGGDVSLCEGQVLESHCSAPKLGSILNRRTRVCSELHLQVDQSHARLTISHGCTLDDVQRVSAPMEEHPVWTVLNSNAEEVVKRPKFHHHKFPL